LRHKNFLTFIFWRISVVFEVILMICLINHQECLILNSSDFPFLKLYFLLEFRVFTTCSAKGSCVISNNRRTAVVHYLHWSHWMNSKWQPSFKQLVWLSHGLPHWWHCDTISLVILSPNRWSKRIFTNKFTFNILLYLFGVLNNSAFQLIHFKSLCLKWAEAFRSVFACAVHHQILSS
jgi:hypothetical protein